MGKDYQVLNFTKEDDKKIKKLVKKIGRCWVLIAKELGNRFSAGRIEFRYDNYLRQKKAVDIPWYDEDAERLAELVKEYGKKWTWFTQTFFTNRSPSFLRSKYNTYQNNKKKDAEWKAEQDRWREIFRESQEKVMEEVFPDPPSNEEINFDLFSLD